MDSQDSPRPGRTSPITISAPASARGFVPLTARSAASGRSVQYVGDANPDTLVSSQPNRSANTDTSPAQNGQPSNPSTFDDGTVPPPPTFSRSSAEGEDYASPRGDLPSQDHVDPAPSPASPLANALAQMAGALTTVTAGISALASDKDARKPYLDGPISIEHTFDDSKNDFNQTMDKGHFRALGDSAQGSVLTPSRTTEHPPPVYQTTFLLCLIWLVWFLLAGLGAFFQLNLASFVAQH